MELRRLPVTEWVRFASSLVGVGNQGGEVTTDAAWRSEGYRKAIEGTVSKAQRRKVTDDFLQEVAAIYREHAAGQPIEAIREWAGYPGGRTGHSTVRRWVTLARER